MIEYHQRGRSKHVLVDDDGWTALKTNITSVPDNGSGIPLLGIDVYRNECPCTPDHVESP